MNERIAKLYDQAIAIEDGGDYVCGELDPVKFAELIVQECARVADQWVNDEDNGHNLVSAKLKKHFGVEE